ncbi:MAG: trimeric intracellular cation channel family protein [Longimicrobiales bacterium]
MTLPYLLNLFGVAVFAISGALAAVRKELDLLGIVVAATVTAVGGGTVRDLLLDRPVFWIYERENLITAVGAALFTLLYMRFRRPPDRSLMVADALGLAFFTISGMQIALALNHPGPIAMIMGVITGVVGGVTRDVLTAEIPMVLRGSGLYATAAIAGATLYLLLEAFDVPRPLPSLIGVSSVAFVRIASVAWGIRLPVFNVPDGSRE